MNDNQTTVQNQDRAIAIAKEGNAPVVNTIDDFITLVEQDAPAVLAFLNKIKEAGVLLHLVQPTTAPAGSEAAPVEETQTQEAAPAPQTQTQDAPAAGVATQEQTIGQTAAQTAGLPGQGDTGNSAN